MKLIVCVDDDFGMMFNKRRQSKDSVLRQRLQKVTEGEKLFVSEYTGKQFEEEYDGLKITDKCARKAKKDDFYFVEDLEYDIDECTEVILYKWNRRYPQDRKFEFSPKEQGFELVSTYEFEGSSHEKITEERYERK